MAVLSPNEVAHVVLTSGLTGPDVTKMVAIAGAESAYNTEAVARSQSGPHLGQRALGLFMISNKAHPDKIVTGDWRDPYINGGWMFKVYKAQGLGAWNVTKTGPNGEPPRYLAFMPDAEIAVLNPTPAPRSLSVYMEQAMQAVNQVSLVSRETYAAIQTDQEIMTLVDAALRRVRYGAVQ